MSLVVLTLALRGRLKVGLDVEQACQGVVTHTRSVRQLVTPPSCLGSGSGACASYPPTPVALCEPKGVLNSRLQLTLVFLALAWTAASAWRVQLSRHSRMARPFWDSNSIWDSEHRNSALFEAHYREAGYEE